MCQSIQTAYKFCGCQGEFYQQTCPEPTATCQLLLKNPTELKLTCYCEKHSSQTFKTVRKDQRDTARFNKEYNKILAREEQQRQQSPHRARPVTITKRPRPGDSGARAKRETSQAGRARDQRIPPRQRNPSSSQTKTNQATAIRPQERRAKSYKSTWADGAMKRKDLIAQARARAEEASRQKAQDNALANGETQTAQKRSLRSCLIM
jgi:hypothetical protein